jgi:hypothetical protein
VSWISGTNAHPPIFNPRNKLLTWLLQATCCLFARLVCCFNYRPSHTTGLPCQIQGRQSSGLNPGLICVPASVKSSKRLELWYRRLCLRVHVEVSSGGSISSSGGVYTDKGSGCFLHGHGAVEMSSGRGFSCRRRLRIQVLCSGVQSPLLGAITRVR